MTSLLILGVRNPIRWPRDVGNIASMSRIIPKNNFNDPGHISDLIKRYMGSPEKITAPLKKLPHVDLIRSTHVDLTYHLLIWYLKSLPIIAYVLLQWLLDWNTILLAESGTVKTYPRIYLAQHCCQQSIGGKLRWVLHDNASVFLHCFSVFDKRHWIKRKDVDIFSLTNKTSF